MIKVLALNDDNHGTCFVTKNKVYYNEVRFMEECLLKPHNEEYVVRGVHICEPSGALEALDENEFINMFTLLEVSPEDINSIATLKDREDIFDLFFDNGTKYWR